MVDISVATVSDWKLGYCTTNILSTRERCCENLRLDKDGNCELWHAWASSYVGAFGIYVGFALAFGIISASATLLTKSYLPAAASSERRENNGDSKDGREKVHGKTMYLAAGSGIPEIKTILSGFVIPHFLDFKVLAIKAIGATFAVSTGMCLGKEGPFVHISTCVAYLIGMCFPKYRDNGRKMREILSAGCSAGLSVAFGAPIGGVLFSYEVCHAKRRNDSG